MRYAFAGDRAISCTILDFMIRRGHKPLALFVTQGARSTHAQQLMEIANLDPQYVFVGNSFKEEANIIALQQMELDYIIGIHFPYIIPKAVLDIPKIGFLNLHPAYLPYNKGWHTPSWAILDKTPCGATLHFMAEALDEGDIVHQKKITVSPTDTANTLYQKVLNLEKEVFFEAFEDLVGKGPKRIPQSEKGTAHTSKDLKSIQEIDLNKDVAPLEILDKIRALTTNKKSEAAYFVVDGQKIGLKVELFEIAE